VKGGGGETRRGNCEPFGMMRRALSKRGRQGGEEARRGGVTFSNGGKVRKSQSAGGV